MHLLKPKSPGVGTVVKSEICTAGGRRSAAFVRHIEIDVSGTALCGNFRVGQSFGVLPPGVDERGKPHKLRLYSIASPSCGEDGQGQVVSTTVKRVVDEHWETHGLFLGVASNYLCDLQPGDKVSITGPSGRRFLLPADPGAHDYVFFATGTGIAPFRGMVLELLASKVASRLVLVMGAPYATELLYHEDFLRLQAEHENFHYLTAISRERQADGADPMYCPDRIRTHRDLIVPILDSDRGLIYVCGIAGMEVGVFSGLARELSPDALDRYVRVDPPLMRDPGSWKRSMMNKQIRPTPNAMLEVY